MITVTRHRTGLDQAWLKSLVDDWQALGGALDLSAESFTRFAIERLSSVAVPRSPVEVALLRAVVGDIVLQRMMRLGGKRPAEYDALVSAVAPLPPVHDPARPLDPRIDAALHATRRALHDPSVRLATVATIAGMSRWHFSRVFKRITGMSFSEYLRSARLQLARMLLTTTTLSVKEVSSSAGFRHQSDFCRRFRERYGATPKQWQREHVR